MKRSFLIPALVFMSLISSAQNGSLFGNPFEGVVRQPDEFVEIVNQIPQYPDSIDLFKKLLILEALEGQVSELALRDFWKRLQAADSTQSMDDDNWLVRLNCQVACGGELHPTTFLLKMVEDSLFDYQSWRIVGAESTITKNDTASTLSISPVSHNIDFLPFGKNLKYGNSNLRGMVLTSYEYDELTALMILFERGLARLERIDDHTLLYPNLHGYAVQVEKRPNGGEYPSWGITDLTKVTDE